VPRMNKSLYLRPLCSTFDRGEEEFERSMNIPHHHNPWV
jgi:hypothetical protein